MSNLLTNGLNSIYETYINLIHKKENNEELATSSSQPTPATCASNISEKLFERLIENDENDSLSYDDDIILFKKKKEIETETLIFTDLIRNTSFLTNKFSTKQFWIKHSTKMPNLTQLAIILLSIQCSGAFIERFFSICGFVSTKRSASMSDELIIMRCLLKSNMKLLTELSETHDDL